MRLKPYLLLFCIFLFGVVSAEKEKQGNLIVTYQTGSKGEKLSRVRFWLKNERGDRRLYPKGNAYVEDPIYKWRMVLVENLPPGNYTIQFSIPNSDALFEEIPLRQVLVIEDSVVKIDQVIKPRYASLELNTIIDPPTNTLDKTLVSLVNAKGEIESRVPLGHQTIEYLTPGNYTLKLADIQGYVTPKVHPLILAANNHVELLNLVYSKDRQGIISPEQIVFVTEGEVLMGDPLSLNKANESEERRVRINSFRIGLLEVTNSQYAEWLTYAWKRGEIRYQNEGKQKGTLTDQAGHYLFNTTLADPLSQITVENKHGETRFLPLLGKESYPVICVSWYGAMAFCTDNHLRLPTEAEWEKAAGMAIAPPGEHLKKYRYGFSEDDIDITRANYKDKTVPTKAFSVRTTPVGFYNGKNSAEIEGNLMQTRLSVSPSGAFDMSGNVWEWVSDWNDENYYTTSQEDNPRGPLQGQEKVAKGGCYDSLAEGTRVAERIGLHPEHRDVYTGFRVAADK